MLKQKYFLTGIFILSAERQPIKLSWRKIVWLQKYVFDGQDNIRTKTRYAMEQGLKGMMSWDLATDLPLDDSKSLLKVMVEELRK